MATPLRKARRGKPVRRRVTLHVANGELPFNDRIEMLLAAILMILEGDVQLEKVLSADFPGGCVEMLLLGRLPFRVPEATVAVQVRAWP